MPYLEGHTWSSCMHTVSHVLHERKLTCTSGGLHLLGLHAHT